MSAVENSVYWFIAFLLGALVYFFGFRFMGFFNPVTGKTEAGEVVAPDEKFLKHEAKHAEQMQSGLLNLQTAFTEFSVIILFLYGLVRGELALVLITAIPVALFLFIEVEAWWASIH